MKTYAVSWRKPGCRRVHKDVTAMTIFGAAAMVCSELFDETSEITSLTVSLQSDSED